MKEPDLSGDEELIRLCIARDPSAWERFTKRYSGLISYSIVQRLRKYGINPHPNDLGEIRQDILSRLWEDGKLAEIRNPSVIKYWLSIVSGNMAVEYMRARKRRHELMPVSLSEMTDESALHGVLSSNRRLPADELHRSELLGKIEESIRSLPAKQALALKLNLLHGKSHDEISAIMSIPPGTASSYIKRAKGALRRMLKDYR